MLDSWSNFWGSAQYVRHSHRLWIGSCHLGIRLLCRACPFLAAIRRWTRFPGSAGGPNPAGGFWPRCGERFCRKRQTGSVLHNHQECASSSHPRSAGEWEAGAGCVAPCWIQAFFKKLCFGKTGYISMAALWACQKGCCTTAFFLCRRPAVETILFIWFPMKWLVYHFQF